MPERWRYMAFRPPSIAPGLSPPGVQNYFDVVISDYASASSMSS